MQLLYRGHANFSDAAAVHDSRVHSQLMSPDAKRVVRRRHRIKGEQQRILESEFARDSSWLPAQVRQLANRLDYDYVKVYKWGWDRKKKLIANQPSQP